MVGLKAGRISSGAGAFREVDAVGKADVICTGRKQPRVDAVVTQVAFHGDPGVAIEVDGTEGAGVDAGPAPLAVVAIQDDDTVRGLS